MCKSTKCQSKCKVPCSPNVQVIDPDVARFYKLMEDPKNRGLYVEDPNQPVSVLMHKPFSADDDSIVPKANPTIGEPSTPPYYDNSKGSLYHIAEQRGWGVRLFDLVKRLERGGKKDPMKQEIEKSIGVLQLWLKELEG